MSFWEPCEVLYKPRAVKDLAKMEKEDEQRIRKTISHFAQTGEGDVKLIDIKWRIWEIRVGLHFRAAFMIGHAKIEVLRVWRK